MSQPAIDAKMLEGLINAPEFPDGLAWLNTEAPIKLRDLRGKFVLLDFWTFCCINCMHIIPDLKKLEAKYEQELVVIGVHSAKFQNEKDTSKIREAILRYEIAHPVVNDADFRVWSSYTARAWPTLVLINPKGKVIGSMSGEGVFEPFDRVLSQAIPYFEAKNELVRSPLKTALEAAARPEMLLSYPGKIFADAAGRRLFITDSNHHRILVATAEGKILDVIGGGEQGQRDGRFEEAGFHHPQGTFLAGEILYIADTENHLLRAANLTTRNVATVLGTGAQARRMNAPGQGREVALNSPWDVLVHNGTAYIAMAGSHQIWAADTKTWAAGPFAGSAREDIIDGKRGDAALAQTSGLATDGQRLYFADSETSSVRSVGLSPEGEVATIVGKGLFKFGDQDGACDEARFQHPLGVAWHKGRIYVADTYNSKVKVIDPGKCQVSTLVGGSFNEPGGLAWLDGKLYVVDTNNHLVRVVDAEKKTVTTLELTGLEKLSTGRAKEFEGRSVRLGPFDVQPGKTSLAVSLDLPDGYKLNRDAPLYLAWNAPEAKLESKPGALEARIAGLSGRSEVRLDAIVYYCTTEQSVCLVDRLHVLIAVNPVAQGPGVIPIPVEVRKPRSAK